jgi:predicted enzyme related to lactoylglutathione lyase
VTATVAAFAPILDGAGPAYVAVGDVAEALERVEAFGGSVVTQAGAWAICTDSEGSPFGLAQESLEG